MQQNIKNTNQNCDVLLVDDDIDKHFVAPCSLGEIGCDKKLLSFDNAPNAINYLHSLSKLYYPSLIVLNYNITLMNGQQMLEYLKITFRFCNIPVIVWSTQMNNNMKLDLMESGAAGCFRKSHDMKKHKIFLAVLAVIYDTTLF